MPPYVINRDEAELLVNRTLELIDAI